MSPDISMPARAGGIPDSGQAANALTSRPSDSAAAARLPVLNGWASSVSLAQQQWQRLFYSGTSLHAAAFCTVCHARSATQDAKQSQLHTAD